jgi:uncharacterized ferritin-like protein (DUF455 family)
MTPLPPDGTLERWAYDYLASSRLSHKLVPPLPPRDVERDPVVRRLAAPGRPPELAPGATRLRSASAAALREPTRRAQLLHTFLHHELQAAELMCWAVLAFPAAPPAFRRGLVGIALDEIRHMQMYGEHLDALGFSYGDWPVNDWFWERVPAASSPAEFVAGMGMGFEGGNLDHAQRFAARFREAGDERAAVLQEKVCEEEVPHVALATRWFRAFTGGLEFDVWRRHLPAPLSPMVMRGPSLNTLARQRAGFPQEFLEKLARW